MDWGDDIGIVWTARYGWDFRRGAAIGNLYFTGRRSVDAKSSFESSEILVR